MSKLTNNPLDLKSSLLKTKHNDFDFSIPEEIKKDISKPEEESEETLKVEKKQDTTTQKNKEEPKIKKSYRLSQELLNDIEKIVYMDRELRGNSTNLVTKAIENYVYSKEGKELLRQYEELKGGK